MLKLIGSVMIFGSCAALGLNARRELRRRVAAADAMLLALRLKVIRMEDVKEVGLFLTGIFPLLFVPAAAGVMELWAEMGSMLLPILLAIFPVTVLVLITSGHTTQALVRRKQKGADHDGTAE